jgi:predicted RNase H-like nuclease (RuvC/YqgF family)
MKSKEIFPEEERKIPAGLVNGDIVKRALDTLTVAEEELSDTKKDLEEMTELATANSEMASDFAKTIDHLKGKVKDSEMLSAIISKRETELSDLKKENERLKEEIKYNNQFVRMLKTDVLELSNKAQEYEECSDNPENGDFFKGKAEAYKYASKKINGVINYHGFNK